MQKTCGFLNSCFTGVLEQEVLKKLSELGATHTVRGREGKKQETGRKKKGFQDRNFCLLTLTRKSRELPSCQNNYLKFEITVVNRYCTWEKWAG